MRCKGEHKGLTIWIHKQNCVWTVCDFVKVRGEGRGCCLSVRRMRDAMAEIGVISKEIEDFPESQWDHWWGLGIIFGQEHCRQEYSRNNAERSISNPEASCAEVPKQSLTYWQLSGATQHKYSSSSVIVAPSKPSFLGGLNVHLLGTLSSASPKRFFLPISCALLHYTWQPSSK